MTFGWSVTHCLPTLSVANDCFRPDRLG